MPDHPPSNTIPNVFKPKEFLEMPKVLAVIPARGGSKGLPGKNIRQINGHPLIAYSIASGLSAKLVERVICSTDNQKIADIATHYGAEVPFLRPNELAQDQSPDIDTFQHLIQDLKIRDSYRPDIIVQLRPTSPIRQLGQVDAAINVLLSNPETDSVRCVTLSPATPYKMWRINEGRLTPLLTIDNIPEPFNLPRQTLPEIYWQTGTIDVIRTSVIESGSMTGNEIRPFIVEQPNAIDIDNLESFDKAEQIISSIECIKPSIIEY
ncbi:MAG: acylneuraminate cytidylyltransferase family protein [Chloroflexota bacterium]|nr:acylneuraminate cytidylyltransferase family protein [Chloroflexota bacterium]